MNLAIRDIRHSFGRFALTTVGIGLLLMIVMGMGGIYRGLIREATLLVVIEAADLLSLGAIVLGISVLASLLGIWKAMRVEPNKVLS